jgi:FKBP-type peptidyl-prolyl cis-trans isomerase
MSRKKNLVSMLLISAVIFTLGSCMKSKTAAEYEAEEQLKINNFLSQNPSLTFEQKASGLYFLQTKAGTGALAKKGDTVYVKYTGKFLDGYTFDSNVGTNDTLVFPLHNEPELMIPGFEEGVSYMNLGSKAKLIVPSKLAYGPYGFLMIAGYTPLIYDMELVKLVPKAK